MLGMNGLSAAAGKDHDEQRKDADDDDTCVLHGLFPPVNCSSGRTPCKASSSMIFCFTFG